MSHRCRPEGRITGAKLKSDGAPVDEGVGTMSKSKATASIRRT
jgi:hypothetical protein